MLSLVEDLDGNIDDLEEALAPLLKTAFSVSTSKLPLLDKAKLYVLATYAIESILFSALRLNGVDAKAHPVFQELNRVKEYFEKIKTAETAGTKRSTTVDKQAAGRFIKHGLAGNDRYDRERSERMARERAGSKRKLEDMQARVGTHTRFKGTAKRIRATERDDTTSRDQEGSSAADFETPEPVLVASNPPTIAEQKLERKAARRQRHEAEAPPAEPALRDQGESEEQGLADVPGGSANATDADSAKPLRTPKSHSESFQALLQRPAAGEPEKPSKKKKRKSKGQVQQKLENQLADEMK